LIDSFDAARKALGSRVDTSRAVPHAGHRREAREIAR
jgi:hypothetical protein